jgi:hypothetical protein
MSRMLFALAAIVAFVAGRYTAPEAAPAKPVVTVRTEAKVERVVMHCPPVIEIEDEPYEDPDAIDVADTEAVRMVAAESERIARLEASLGMKGALRGQIKDAKTGERLPGVTVVASNGNDAYTAITDEDGTYDILMLPEGRYTVTMYYLDRTVEHSDLWVAAQKITAVYGTIDQSAPLIEPNGITITHDYVRTIDVPAEGFTEGVSFNGSEATEDAYYD